MHIVHYNKAGEYIHKIEPVRAFIAEGFRVQTNVTHLFKLTTAFSKICAENHNIYTVYSIYMHIEDG